MTHRLEAHHTKTDTESALHEWDCDDDTIGAQDHSPTMEEGLR